MSCSICGDGPRTYCGSCMSATLLTPRIELIKELSNVAELRKQVEATVSQDSLAVFATVPGGGKVAALEARIVYLQAKLKATNRDLLQCQSVTQHVRENTDRLATTTAAQRKIIAARRKGSTSEQKLRLDGITKDLEKVEKSYVSLYHHSLPAQSRCCSELLDLFVLKKKRKRNQEYDVVLGFNTIPDFCQLGHYAAAVINSGVERLAWFVVLLASYLGIRLPYDVTLPGKNAPYTTVGTDSQPLHISHSIRTMMRTTPVEFHAYCRHLAMLAMDVASVAGRIGVPTTSISAISRPHQLIAQLYLRLESLIKAGHQIQVHAVSLSADVDSIQDFLISAIDVDLNGKSAEWNIVDAPT